LKEYFKVLSKVRNPIWRFLLGIILLAKRAERWVYRKVALRIKNVIRKRPSQL